MEKGGQISGGGGAGGGWDSIFENDQSAKVNDIELGLKLFQLSSEICGAEWPDMKQVRSPCPTLNVIGAISKGMIAKEELKRMEDRPGFNADGTPIRKSKAKKAAKVADKVVSGVFRNTIGRVGRFASRRILGKVPEEAIQGSYQEEKPKEKVDVAVVAAAGSAAVSQTLNDQAMIEQEISDTIFNEYEETQLKTDEDLFNEMQSAKDSVSTTQSETDSKSTPVA